MNFKFNLILILWFTCFSAIADNNLSKITRIELVKKGDESRHMYIGEKELLTDVQNTAEELLKRDPNDYEGLLLKSWFVKREGYYNSEFGYNSNNLEQSYQLISRAISLKPNNWKAWKELTFLFIDARKIEEAKESAEKLHKLQVSTKDKTYIHLKTMIDMSIFQLEKKYENVLTLGEKCRTNSTDVYDKKQCFYREGQAYLKLGNLERYVYVNQQIFNMFPENAWTVGNLGGAHFKIKDYPAAINYYEKAIKIRRYGLALAELGSLYAVMARRYLSEEKKSEALSFMDKLLTLGVHDESTGLFASSVAMKNFGDQSLKEKILLDGIKNVPNSGRLKVDLGTLYRNQKKYKEALDVYDQLFFKEGWNNLDLENKVFVANQMAWINLWGLAEKDSSRAIEILENVKDIALQSNGYKAEYFMYLASAFHDKSWLDKSISLSNKSLELYNQALVHNPDKKENIQKNINNVQANIRNFKKQGIK